MTAGSASGRNKLEQFQHNVEVEICWTRKITLTIPLYVEICKVKKTRVCNLK